MNSTYQKKIEDLDHAHRQGVLDEKAARYFNYYDIEKEREKKWVYAWLGFVAGLVFAVIVIHYL